MESKRRMLFENHQKNNQSFEYMHWIRRYRRTCDVTLITRNGEVAAHKIVLSSCCLYFHIKFVMQKSSDTLFVEGMECSILRALVNYMYTSKLPITMKTVKGLLSAASMLMLREVWEKCCEFLKGRLDPKNCLEIALWAEQNKFLQLKTETDDYICLHLSEVMNEEEFLKRSHRSLLALLDVAIELVCCCCCKERCVSSETLMESILSWISYNRQMRQDHLDELLDYVDIGSLPLDYLIRKEDDPLLQSSLQYMQKAMETIVRHYKQDTNLSSRTNDEQRDKTPDLAIKTTSPVHNQPPVFRNSISGPSVPATGTNCNDKYSKEEIDFSTKEKLLIGKLICKPVSEKKNILVVAGRNGAKLSVERYNFKKKQWLKIPVIDQTSMHDGCGIIFVGTKIYVIGGTMNSNVDCYDLVLKKWFALEPLGEKRGFVGIATVQDCIYAVGGYSSGVSSPMSNIAKVLKPNVGKWKALKSMGSRRCGSCLGFSKGIIYVIGGHTVEETLKSVEGYDPAQNKWSQMPSMLSRRYNAGVAELGGILYVVGGRVSNSEFLSTAESFNPELRRWAPIPNMHVPRERAGVVAFKQKIYVMGGRNKTGLLRSVEMYDLQMKCWTLLPEMLTAKENVCTTLMDPVNEINRYHL